LFVELDEERSLLAKGGHTRRTTVWRCGCCCPHKAAWRSIQTNNMRSSHTSCVWRWTVGLWTVTNLSCPC